MARDGIGTIIGRKSTSKGRDYHRIWIYVPTKVSDDTAFPFHAGDPCVVAIDTTRKQLTIKPIAEHDAKQQGWLKRKRSEAK